MSDNKRWIAALERARAELEVALSADPDWRALRQAVAARAEHERALAGNPVYRCWEQLDAAIAALRRKAQGGLAGPATERRRISLRDVLEHIRSDAALQETDHQATSAAERSEPSRTPPSGSEPPFRPAGPATPLAGTGNARSEPEEATVSFVIRREPARPATVAGHGAAAFAPKQPAPPETPRPEPEPGPGTEAEVIIVPRR